jgi:N-glycosidase YbiA
VKSGKPPAKGETDLILSRVMNAYREGKVVYIHCSGGHGRAGTVGALICGKMYQWDAKESIEHIERCRETRIDTSRNFIPTPETNAQVSFLVKHLGLKEGSIAPDRSDRTWLARVKRERSLAGKKRTQETDVIKFYEKTSPYYEFSNYYLQPVAYNGNLYPSSEHAYQAAKFDYEGSAEACAEYMEVIRGAATPNIARELANQTIKGGYPWRTALNPIIERYAQRGVRINPHWDDIKVGVMECILRAKFNNGDLRTLLHNTGDRTIIEDSPRDSFWGRGKDGDGHNTLGKLLMKIRNTAV